MSKVVHARGDVQLVLGGTSYHLRPCFAALAAIERDVAPVLKLVQSAAAGEVKIEDMATVFHHCCLDDPDKGRPEIAEFGEMIMVAGILAPLRSYRDLLAGMLGVPGESR